jgi:hypothetical protein
MREPPPACPDLASVRPGSEGIVFAVLRRAREGRTRVDTPYLDLELGDTTAVVAAKVWSDTGRTPELTEVARGIPSGSVIKVHFTAETWHDALQLKVLNLRAARDEEFDPAVLFVAGCPAAAGLAARRLVLDIETVAAFNIRDLPATVVEGITRIAEQRDGDVEKVTALSPLLSRVVSLAVGDAEGEGGTVLFVPPAPGDFAAAPDWIRVVTEPELLAAFWELAAGADTVITYNGRDFDIPFLQIRSAIHGIPCRADLLSDRYGLRPHLDLRRLLTGGDRGLGPLGLDAVCFAFGIESPKHSMDGSMVGKAYQSGRYEEIARYNLADVHATRRLFHLLADTLLRFRKDWVRQAP